MKRAALILAALAVVACSGGGPSAGPSAATRSSGSPSSSPTSAATPSPGPTLTPVPAGVTCPPSTELSVRDFVDADRTCFVGVELTMRAWLDFSPPIGWEGPGIEPSWVAFPATGGPAALWQAPPIDENNLCDSETQRDCAWFFAHLDPTRHVVLGTQRWVRVTGHIADPAADTCHYVPYDGMEEPLPDASYAVATCRNNFVVTSIVDAP